MSRIMELADAYAKANRAEANVLEQGTDDELVEACNETRQARAALVAEVEKLEAENAKLRKALSDLLNSEWQDDDGDERLESARKQAREAIGAATGSWEQAKTNIDRAVYFGMKGETKC